MVMPQVHEQLGMAMEDFIRLYDQEGPFELIDGESRRLMPNVAGHGAILKLLYDLLLACEKTASILVQRELPYVLAYSPTWVTGSRVPDLMIYRAERMNAYMQEVPDWRDKPYLLVPDLCVEIISPNDNCGDVDDKVARYLSDGVRVIWVVNPRTRTIHVYKLGSDRFLRLTVQDTLAGDDVVAGFEIAVRDVFGE
jgi:Uma2 family endonuclease